MKHARPATLFIVTCGFLFAQASYSPPWKASIPPDLAFEVASLHPSPPNSPGGGIRPAPGGLHYLASNVTLRTLIIVAYRFRPDQISGGPSWMNSERFDMDAKSERPASVDELHVMLQNLLADRFHLRFHVESKQAPIYVLSAGKSPARLVRHQPRTPDETAVDLDGEGLNVVVTGKAAPMGYFTWRLSQILDRPVADRTGIEGSYDFQLSFFRDPPMAPDAPPAAPPGPNVFEAVRDQLGLRLDRDRGWVEVMVIDNAGKPSEN